MGAYYISVCHDCKKKVHYMDKWVEESAKYYHKKFTEDHSDCNTELGDDYMDDWCFKIWKYDRVDDREYIE